MKIWIEMSKENEHGGGDWGLTKCIWAPTYKNGKDRKHKWPFWENVLKVKKNDLVLHLCGKGKETRFIGVSTVEIDGYKTTDCPPIRGHWSYCDTFYKATLQNFIAFDEPIYLYHCFNNKNTDFKEYYKNKKGIQNLFFTIQSGTLRCLNGGYLSEADEVLIDLIFGLNRSISDLTIQLSTPTSEVFREIKSRIGQSKFSENVKRNYNFQCCFPGCDMSDEKFLVASHISRWADNEKKRGETSNGLCLCLLHDKAFEIGYFSLDDELKVCIHENDTRPVFLKYILPYKGMMINKGLITPDKEALKEHRNRFNLLIKNY